MITKRVSCGSSGYSVARHAAPLLGMYRVIKVSKYQRSVVPLMLLVHDVNAFSSFSVGQAHVPCDRDPDDPAALRAFERDLDRLVRVVESCSVECPLSTVGASHGNIHRISSCCMLLARKLT